MTQQQSLYNILLTIIINSLYYINFFHYIVKSPEFLNITLLFIFNIFLDDFIIVDIFEFFIIHSSYH